MAARLFGLPPLTDEDLANLWVESPPQPPLTPVEDVVEEPPDHSGQPTAADAWPRPMAVAAPHPASADAWPAAASADALPRSARSPQLPDGGQPDPVTLSEPSFDDSGLLRWGTPGR